MPKFQDENEEEVEVFEGSPESLPSSIDGLQDDGEDD